ncbi:MAG: hypothetical protein ACK2TU_13095, partial [Anaerolineales bacterium]
PIKGLGRAVGVGHSGVGVASAALIASDSTLEKFPVVMLTGAAAVKIVATITPIAKILTNTLNVSDKRLVFFGVFSVKFSSLMSTLFERKICVKIEIKKYEKRNDSGYNIITWLINSYT